MRTIREVLNEAYVILKKSKISSYALDADILLSHTLKKDRVFLMAHPEKKLTTVQEKNFSNIIKKRALHHPVAYLTGHREFFKLDILATPSALIPRPETEELVEKVLEYFNKNPKVTSVVDVGTGTGAIALALAASLPQEISIAAVDVSDKSLALAKKNATHLKLNKKIVFKKSNLLKGLKDSYDIIISNPPYLSEVEYNRALKLYPELKKEPRSALVAKNKGLYLIEKLLSQAPDYLHHNGAIFLEIGYEQGSNVKKLAKKYLPELKTEIVKDLCGRDRIAIIK